MHTWTSPVVPQSSALRSLIPLLTLCLWTAQSTEMLSPTGSPSFLEIWRLSWATHPYSYSTRSAAHKQFLSSLWSHPCAKRWTSREEYQPGWIEMWNSVKEKRGVYDLWEKGKAAQEDSKDIMRLCREKIRRSKAQQKFNLATAVKDIKKKYINFLKCFFKNISNRKKIQVVQSYHNCWNSSFSSWEFVWTANPAWSGCTSAWMQAWELLGPPSWQQVSIHPVGGCTGEGWECSAISRASKAMAHSSTTGFSAGAHNIGVLLQQQIGPLSLRNNYCCW